MRGTLGEAALLDHVQRGRFGVPEIGIPLLGALLDEWQPGPAEVDGLFGRTESILREGLELSPDLGPAEADWFADGMHESPFARGAGGKEDGVTPER
jgi:hypothetical protein